MPRLFLGFELPEHIKQKLLGVHVELRGARWQRGDQLHLTLRLLGEVDGTVTQQIIEVLSGFCAPAFEISVQGMGCFGGAHKPYALWAGVTPEQPLVQLRKEIDTRLAPLALLPERHSGFTPHITLACIKGGDASAVQFAERQAGLATARFALDAISLFSSRQEEGGSVYSVLQRFPLS